MSSSENFQILTLLPRSWKCRKIEEVFGVSNRVVRKGKILKKGKGILPTRIQRQEEL